MTQLHPVVVNILDKEYHVGCPAAERANLESAARFLDGKMREIRDAGKIFGIERIAVMAALNISYELLQNQPGNKGAERVPTQQASDLLERIDQALHGEDPILRRQQRQAQQGRHVPTAQVVAPSAPAVEMPQAGFNGQQNAAPWEQPAPQQQESQSSWPQQQQNQAPLPQHDWSQQNNGNGGFNNGQ